MPIHFNNPQTIYLQIANYLHEQILLKKIEAGGKLPAIRQLATRLKVNPNTIQRTYHLLARQAVIVRKRGIGTSNQATTSAISHYGVVHFLPTPIYVGYHL